jgi:septal ring factor EnvC (AmiA/AmiB activator)
MIEAAVSGTIAVFTAVVALHSRMHNRISEVDKRIDQVELRIAEKYVQREELTSALQKMEDHMVRIEGKLDKLIFNEKV